MIDFENLSRARLRNLQRLARYLGIKTNRIQRAVLASLVHWAIEEQDHVR